MKLAVGISTYGNPTGLDGTLASVCPLASLVVIVHGPYLGFEGRYPHSQYRVKELISKYPNTLLLDNSEPLSQMEARNQYMKESKGCDFLLVMDDDERVVVWNEDRMKEWCEDTVEKHGDNPTMFNVWLFPKIDSDVPFDMPGRLFYLPGRIRYLGNHYNFTIDGVHVGRSSKYSVDSRALTIRHLDPNTAERTDEFEKSMEQYEIWQHYGEKHGNEFG